MSEEELFHAAVAKPSTERTAFLDQACGADMELRRRVEVLLRAHEASGSFLDEPAATGEFVAGPPSATPATTPSPDAGTVIAGRYKLLEEIGEGGMGSVWVAEQTQPVRRKVALKLIKAGMDSKSVLARFEAERQALAVMDHPNIAKVLDGGLTDSGRPFFVMEYVKGVPITEYCDATRLSVPERLQLFVQVCQAVQHAHQKGIIHRDLKPSNILVAPYDDKPVPKVIDFGLAKALHQPLTEKTLHTAHETVLGTPLYMSPEQAQLNNLDVDTRADIYSLGVLLYELLTGTTPLELKRFREAAWDEIRRVIREEEPPRPSARLSSTDTLPSLAANRQMEPAKLTRLVRGELDWIVMKALEKDRGRRYETANGFGMDLQRYLSGEPVLAAPPSRRYRLRKFLRRNRAPVVAVGLIVLALLIGVIGTTLGLISADRAWRDEAAARVREGERADGEASERRRAVTAEKAAKDNEARVVQALARAERERRISTAVRDFLHHRLLNQASAAKQADSLLRAGGSATDVLENPTIRELLDRAAKELASDKIEKQFPGEPIVQAEILRTIGETYMGIGDAPQAIAHLERALQLYAAEYGPEHSETLVTRNNLACAYVDAGKQTDAVHLFEELREPFIKNVGPEHRNTLSLLDNIATNYRQAGRLQESIALHKHVVEVRTRTAGINHQDTLTAQHNLARAYLSDWNLPEAIRLFERVRTSFLDLLGPDHPETLACLDSLAEAYVNAGNIPQGIRLFEEVRDRRTKKLGADHPATLRALNNLGWAYLHDKQITEAVRLLERVCERRLAKLGADHRDTLLSQQNLGEAYTFAGRLTEAISLLEQVRNRNIELYGPNDNVTVNSMHRLAVAYTAGGRAAEASRLLDSVCTSESRQFGADHPKVLMSQYSLARAYKESGRLAEAIKLLEQVRVKLVKALGEDNEQSLSAGNDLGVMYWLSRRYDEAIRILEEVQATSIKTSGPDHLGTLNTQGNLATVYADASRLPEAIGLLEQLRYRSVQRYGADDSRTLNVMHFLGVVYRKAGKLPEAIQLLDEVRAKRSRKLGPDDLLTMDSVNSLAVAYWTAGKLDRSIPLLQDVVRFRTSKFGVDHVETRSSMIDLGLNMVSVGRRKEAIPILEDVCTWLRKQPETVQIQYSRAFDQLLMAYDFEQQLVKAELIHREALSLARKQFGTDDIRLTGRLEFMSSNLARQMKYAEAEASLRESLTIRAKHEPDVWTTFKVRSMIGEQLLFQKKYREAEPLLLEGYEGMKQRTQTPAAMAFNSPSFDQCMREAIGRLIRLFEGWDKPDETAKWRTELEAYQKSQKKQ
jgi:tetratricopeptide (TPR) repeat protein